MDDSGPTASIVFGTILVLVDMYIYGFGSAIRSLNGKEVEDKAQEGNRKAIRLNRIIENPTEYVNTVQLLVTLINISVGVWLVAPQDTIQHRLVAFALSLYILLSFGVLLPKRMAARNPKKWAYACITPVYWFTMLLKPLTGLITITVQGILFLFGVRDKEDDNDVTEEEIINMVNEGHEQGLIQASEAEMISNIFEFGDKEAQDIMTHRNNIVAIDGDTSLEEAVNFMLAERNSRYPVYEENIDHIIGILHLKDAMRSLADCQKTNLPVKEQAGLLREPHFVPQTKNIDELFKEMQSKKLQMVIVVDEYGQTDGLVAMEDILEEIVGNIMDEYDEDGNYIQEKGQNEYVMDGKTPLEELEEKFHIDFADETFETLNGFLISRLDRIPEPDEKFGVDYEGYHFEILSVENKMITKVLVRKLDKSDASGKQEREAAQSMLEETGKK